MLPDSKFFFMRQTLIARLKRFTRDPSKPLFDFSIEASQLFPWISDITFVAYPKSGLSELMQTILRAAENHATATTNVVKSYPQLRRQFPFLPVLRATHAGSSWRHQMLDASDLRSYSPGEWVSGGKVVFVHRDPRDVLAATFEDLRSSLYLRDIKPIDIIDNEIVGARKLSRFISRWRDWCHDNPNCHVISFDELERDRVSEIRRLSEFCGFGFSAATIAVACEAVTSRSNKSKNSDDAVSSAGNGLAASSDVWSVGVPRAVLAYQDLFSDDERRRIEDIIANEIEPRPRMA